jgi:hypothetical protein
LALVFLAFFLFLLLLLLSFRGQQHTVYASIYSHASGLFRISKSGFECGREGCVSVCLCEGLELRERSEGERGKGGRRRSRRRRGRRERRMREIRVQRIKKQTNEGGKDRLVVSSAAVVMFAA